MDFKKIVLWFFAALGVLAVWLYWWVQPERQVRRAQARLFSALESRDFDSMAALIAQDYGDRWEHDKAFVVRECRTVFSQFLTLAIERTGGQVEMRSRDWVVREKVMLKGIGGPLAMYARDEVNALDGPFTMTWRKRGWKPWEWELTSVDHPHLALPR
jgi:hypothetical protein